MKIMRKPEPPQRHMHIGNDLNKRNVQDACMHRQNDIYNGKQKKTINKVKTNNTPGREETPKKKG